MRFNGPAAARILEDRQITVSAAARGCTARGCRIERSHLSNVLAGRRGAGVDLIKAFADFVGIDPMTVVGPEDPKAAVIELARLYKLTGDDLAASA